MAVMNVATYVFTVLAARLLGPQAYGAFASLLAVLLVIIGHPARHPDHGGAADLRRPGHVAQIEREILGLTYRAAAVVGLVLLVLTPMINQLLKLESLGTAVAASH